MRPRDAGMALLIAVWAVVLIGGLVAGMVAIGGSESAITANHIETARARHLAVAGVNRAIAALTDPQERDKLSDGGSAALRVRLQDDAEITVSIRDSCAAIDINWAPAELLRAYATVIGLPAADAQRFADSIVARRQTALQSGAKLDTGPWQSLHGLAESTGLDAVSVERLRPGLTLNCLEAGADPILAGDAVKQALGLAGLSGSPSHRLAYEIVAQARLVSGAKVTLEAAIWLAREAGPPYYYVTGWQTY